MVLSNLGANLLGNLLPGKAMIRAGKSTIISSKGTVRECQDF